MGDTKSIIVVGLGNPLMADEGIGVILIAKLTTLASEGKLPSETVEYYDGGCGGMSLLHIIEGKEKAILIDCARMGLAPGSVRRFSPEDVTTIKMLTHWSLHEVDILKVLELARMLGQCPKEIVIFGIEPEAIVQRMELSKTLISRLDEYASLIERELCQSDT